MTERKFLQSWPGKGRTATAVWLCFLALTFVSKVSAKTLGDFDPNLDFSKFKTVAYLGGVEHHLDTRVMQRTPPRVDISLLYP